MGEGRRNYVFEGVREMVGGGIRVAKLAYQILFDPAFYHVNPSDEGYRNNWEIPAGRMLLDLIAIVVTTAIMPDIKHGITLNPLHVLAAAELGLMASYASDLVLTGVAILGASRSEN